jgi:hypothetical protein
MLKNEKVSFTESIREVPESPVSFEEINNIVKEGVKERDHFVSTFWPLGRPLGGGVGGSSSRGTKSAGRTLGKIFRSASGG